MPINPDAKDWTWVTQQPCQECGFDPADATIEHVVDVVLGYPDRWLPVLSRSDVAQRPDDATWSPLEYGAHVRDVLELFRERLHLMVQTDGVAFDNWDQDVTSVAKEYHSESPTRVLQQLVDEAALTARAFREIPDAALDHRGVRSNGSAFTVRSLSAYFLHDLVHHLDDVGG